jgi:hypothetical protein
VAFKGVILLATLCPEQLRLSAERLVLAIAPSLSHRHAAVRVLALQAIGSSVLVDASSFKDIWPSVKILGLDSHPSVRRHLYELCINWQLHLIDRYTYAHRMISIILLGLSDEVVEHQVICRNGIAVISCMYEKEWHDQLKQRMDYFTEEESKLLGFRVLLRENLLTLTDTIVEDLQNWTEPVRKGAIRLLRDVIPFAEHHICGYIGKIFPALAKQVGEKYSEDVSLF